MAKRSQDKRMRKKNQAASKSQAPKAAFVLGLQTYNSMGKISALKSSKDDIERLKEVLRDNLQDIVKYDKVTPDLSKQFDPDEFRFISSNVRDILLSMGVPLHLLDFVERAVNISIGNPDMSLNEFEVALVHGKSMRAAPLEMPSTAPALWLYRDKTKGETPPDFIKTHYAPWLGKGLTRAHIRRLDRSLYKKLADYLIDHPMPADLDLPTQKEENDRWADRVQASVTAAGGPPLLETTTQVDRLRSVARRRGKEPI